jgi:hypothetical protein
MPTRFTDDSLISASLLLKAVQNFPEISDQITHELTRLQRRKNIPERFIFNKEINPEHWTEHKEIMLHQHGIIVNIWDKKTGEYLIKPSDLDNILGRVWSNFYGKEVNVRSAGHVDTIRSLTDLARYQAKCYRAASYMTKSSKILAEVRLLLFANCKGMSWVNIDKETRKVVKDSVVRLSLEEVDIRTIREIVNDINMEYQEKTGWPLFSDPWQYVKEEIPFVLAMLFRVRDIRNTAYAIGLLLDRLRSQGP